MAKFRPTNGVSFGAKYTITTADVNTNAVAEIVTMTVTAGATAGGNVTTTLPSLTGVTTAVLITDTTPTLVGTQIRASTFTGWTTGGTGATVTFTKNVAGAVSGVPTFDGGDTGVTTTVTVTTNGADATDPNVEFDFSIGDSNSFRYPLVAIANIFRAGVLTNPADLTITYPRNGVVRIDGTLVANDVIHLVAQCDSSSYL